MGMQFVRFPNHLLRSEIGQTNEIKMDRNLLRGEGDGLKF